MRGLCGTAGSLWKQVLIYFRAWYLFDVGESHLSCSKILSLNDLRSIGGRNVSWTYFVIDIETTVDFYQYFHLPRQV